MPGDVHKAESVVPLVNGEVGRIQLAQASGTPCGRNTPVHVRFRML